MELNLTKEKLEIIKKKIKEEYECNCGSYHHNPNCCKHGKFDDIYDIVENGLEEFIDILIEVLFDEKKENTVSNL